MENAQFVQLKRQIGGKQENTSRVKSYFLFSGDLNSGTRNSFVLEGSTQFGKRVGHFSGCSQRVPGQAENFGLKCGQCWKLQAKLLKITLLFLSWSHWTNLNLEYFLWNLICCASFKYIYLSFQLPSLNNIKRNKHALQTEAQIQTKLTSYCQINSKQSSKVLTRERMGQCTWFQITPLTLHKDSNLLLQISTTVSRELNKQN